MRRGIEVKPAGRWDPIAAIDCVVLDADDRQRRRTLLTGEKGTTFLLDLESPATLRDGDGLVLDDGTIVTVKRMPEPLTEVVGTTKFDLVRFAWHVGNRHTSLQIVGERLRIRRDHVLETMLRQMGAMLTPIDAPFDPEQGTQATMDQNDHDR